MQIFRNIMATLISVGASLPWGGILVQVFALLGLAGSASAAMVTGWLSPLLLCASILLMSRSFYMIYVRKVATRTTTIVAWCSLVFMIVFWTWYLVSGGVWPEWMGESRFLLSSDEGGNLIASVSPWVARPCCSPVAVVATTPRTTRTPRSSRRQRRESRTFGCRLTACPSGSK